MEALCRCKAERKARDNTGGGDESARWDEGTPRARGPEQGKNAENGSGNGNRNDEPVGILRGALAQVKAKQQAVQWVDEPDKTGSNGVGDEDLGVKPGEDESVGRRGALQLEVQELNLEQQPALQERRKEVQEAPPISE